jgi:prophage tail gpP-like protein
MSYDETIRLVIGDTIFYGWKTATLKKSIEDCCGSFEFTLITLNELQKATIIPQAPCQILIGKTSFLDGYIDHVSGTIGDEGLLYRITGRDKTEDFVDCSVNLPPFSWKAITIFNLASKICNQFGLSLRKVGTFTDEKTEVTLDIGETGFEALSRFAKARNILVTTDNHGTIILGHPGTEKLNDPLVYKKNILRYNFDYDARDRFSKYIIKGAKNSGSGNPWTKTSLTVNGTALDEEVRSSRVKIFSASGTDTNASALERAKWEASSRASRSESHSAILSGFRQSNGALWEHNKLVDISIRSEYIEVITEMLVASVTFSYTSGTEGGRKTSLELRRKDSYAEIPSKLKKKKAKAGIVWKKL